MIINSHQSSHYYNILQTNYENLETRLKPKLQFRKHSILELFLPTNIELYVKDDQAYTFILQPSVTIFFRTISRPALCAM